MRRFAGTARLGEWKIGFRHGLGWLGWLLLIAVYPLATLSSRAANGPGKIWFDLSLENPEDSTSAIISWPSRRDIISEPDNSTATGIVIELITARSNSTSHPGEGVVAAADSSPQLGQGGEEFIENLKVSLAGKGFVFADGFEISDQAPPPKTRLGIEYTSFSENASAPVLPAAFELWVRTSLLPPDSPALHWSIRDLAGNPAVRSFLRTQRGNASPTVGDDTIPANFSLVILPAEGPWLRPSQEGASEAAGFLPIFSVAVATAGEAVRQRALEKPRTPLNRDELSSALRTSFSSWPVVGEISFNPELSAVDNSHTQPNTPAWVLRLTNFDPVRRQTVFIDEIQLGATGRQTWSAFTTHQQTEGRVIDSLAAQKTALEEKLAARLAEQFPWGAARFATPADHETRVAALRRQPGVAAVETHVFRDEVAYSVLWYPVLTSLEAAGTYNSDRGGNVNGKISVQARDFSFGAEGFIANRRRGLFADVSTTPRSTRFGDNAMATWGVLGEYTHESPVRLGTSRGSSLAEEESRAGLRWRLEGGRTTNVKTEATGNSNEAMAVTRSRRWKLDVVAGYRKARLSSDNFAFVERSGGDAPFASTEFTGEWEQGTAETSSQEPGPSGSFQVEVVADASPAHGTTTDFARGQFKASEEIRVNSGRWENSLIRATASAGVASDGTPVAWWFRLGGDERMRGFELGELAGRAFAHVGLEAGISAGIFFPGTKPTAETSAPVLPFDLRKIRVMLGVERAWIGHPPTFSPPGRPLRDGWSYSVSAEYAGAIPGLPGNSRLALGYGYAPESFHRSGRVFVTLRVPLSVPQPH